MTHLPETAMRRGPLARRSSARVAFATCALAIVGSLLACASAPAAELNATPANFASVFASAGSGDTIRLAAGNYGKFAGALKPGPVTITPAAGARASMTLDFDPASNITIDGLHIDDAEIEGAASKNLTIRNSTFDRSQLIFRGEEIVHANILVEHNVFSNFVKCASCFEGRLQLAERAAEPNGITIRDNLFTGGDSDGIQNGGNGTRILNNEFRNLRQAEHSPGDVHLDSIQLYGSKNTLIKGNYFHDVDVGIMCADGCDHETVEDNVFDTPGGSPYTVTWLSDNGSVLQHNTFVDSPCSYNLRCGILYLGNKSSDPAGRGTIVRDNILNHICVCSGSVSGLAQENFNLFQTGGNGASDVRGLPSYVGGDRPTTYEGFALAAGSKGKGDASDGSDRGIRIGSVPAAPQVQGTPRVRVLSSLRTVHRTGRLRLSIQMPAGGGLAVGAVIRPGPVLRSKAGLRPRYSRNRIRLGSRDFGERAAGTQVISLKVSRTARRTLGRARRAGLVVRATVDSTTYTRTLSLKR